MQKSPNTQEEIKKIIRRRNHSKKKGIKACADKRRDGYHCGICGSSEIAWHGVLYCAYCDTEKTFLTAEHWGYHSWLRMDKGVQLPCHHNRTHRLYHIRRISVGSCLSCSSTFGPFCPNCKKAHWVNPTGQKHYCLGCGFRT